MKKLKERLEEELEAEKRRHYLEEQKVLKALWLTKQQLEDTKVSVAYIEMTEQYYQVILLVALYEPSD